VAGPRASERWTETCHLVTHVARQVSLAVNREQDLTEQKKYVRSGEDARPHDLLDPGLRRGDIELRLDYARRDGYYFRATCASTTATAAMSTISLTSSVRCNT
jgi:hypothetical protein